MTTEVDVTELSDMSPDVLHLVKRGANGFPALLAKSVAGEIQAARSALDPTRRPPIEQPRKTKTPKYVRQQIRQQVEARHASSAHQRNVAMSSKKKVAKALTKALAQQSATRLQKGVVVKSVENAVMGRISELEGQLRKAGGALYAPGVAFLLNRELGRISRFSKGVATRDDYADVAAYLSGDSQDHPARSEQQRSTAAAARAVSGAQGRSVNEHMGPFFASPRAALQAIVDGTGPPESIQTFEIQNAHLEKQLAKATSPAERESLGYQLTRRKLLLGHYKGEI